MQLLNGAAKAMRNHIDAVDLKLSSEDEFPIKRPFCIGTCCLDHLFCWTISTRDFKNSKHLLCILCINKLNKKRNCFTAYHMLGHGMGPSHKYRLANQLF